MTQKCHPARFEVQWLVKAGHTEPPIQVYEPHSVPATDGHPGFGRQGRKPEGKWLSIAGLAEAGSQDRNRSGSMGNCLFHRLFESLVGDGQDGQVDGAGRGERFEHSIPSTCGYRGLMGAMRPSNPPPASCRINWLPTATNPTL